MRLWGEGERERERERGERDRIGGNVSKERRTVTTENLRLCRPSLRLLIIFYLFPGKNPYRDITFLSKDLYIWGV